MKPFIVKLSYQFMVFLDILLGLLECRAQLQTPRHTALWPLTNPIRLILSKHTPPHSAASTHTHKKPPRTKGEALTASY